jgi:hypothetical protein
VLCEHLDRGKNGKWRSRVVLAATRGGGRRNGSRSLTRIRAQIRNGRLIRGEHFRRADAGGIELNVDAYRAWLREEQRRRRLPLLDRIRLDESDTRSKQNTSHKNIPGASVPSPVSAHATTERGNRQPKLVPLEVWAEQIFGEYAPHRNTLYNWRRFGWIVPSPIRIGHRYFVEPTAVYADRRGEMARRPGSGS